MFAKRTRKAALARPVHAATASSRRDSINCSVKRSASAAIVAVGFMPADVGHTLPSKMNRFGTSCARPQRVDDRRRRIVAHHRRAEQVPAGRADERRDHRLVRAGGLQRLLRARLVELDQPPRVLRQPVLDLRAPGCRARSVLTGSSTTRLDSSGRSSAMMPHMAEWPSRPRTASWKPAPQIAFSAPHG